MINRGNPKTFDITIALQPKQKEALRMLNHHPVVGYGGARGGGKSFLVRAWQVLRRIKYPHTTGVIIRKTYAELMVNHIQPLFHEYPQLRGYYNKSEKLLEFPDELGGSLLFFRYLQSEDDVYNFQGQEFDDIAVDEATQHSEHTLVLLRASNRTTREDIKPRMLLTFNPGGKGHSYIKRLFIDKRYYENERKDDYGFVQAKVWDNLALLNNDPDYVNRLRALPEEQRRAWLEGDWNIFEGQAFTEWRENVHAILPRFSLGEAPTNWKYRLCWDEGTLKPRAVVLLAQDNDGRVEVVWEYYRTNQTASDAAREIRTQLENSGIYSVLKNNGKFIYDPSMDIKSNQTGRSTSDIVHEILDIRKESGNNNREEGFRRVKEYLMFSSTPSGTVLEAPMLHIWRTCKNMIITLPALSYKGGGEDDVDSDQEDHLYDALRYGLMSFKLMPTRLRGLKQKRDIQKKVYQVVNPLTGY